MAFIDKNTISTNGNLIIPDASIFHFGILTSEMHMTWVKYTCGRLESRFRYSKNICIVSIHDTFACTNG